MKGFGMPIVYQTFWRGQENHKIAVVQDHGRADLLVYLEANRGMAYKEWFWYVTKNIEEAHLKLLFGPVATADFVVSFVRNRGKAGWVKPHRLQGNLWPKN